MRNHKPPLLRKCELLSIPRSSAYYKSTAEPSRDDVLMRAMDEIHLRYPFYGSRRIADELAEDGHAVNRNRVQRLMRRMGMNALYPGPNTSRAHHAYKIYPYLLRGLHVGRANHVWCADITYIPMRKGFVYVVAVMDWYSRKILSWRLSNTLDAEFCVVALSEAFTQVLKDNHVGISMDGKGRCMDNVFIEQLWRSLEYEEVYLKAYENIPEAREGIRRWMDFYNQRRNHQALEKLTPDTTYYQRLNAEAQALA